MPVENEMTKAEYEKALKKAEREKSERTFAFQLEAMKWFYEHQVEFHPVRKWAFDFKVYRPRENEIYFDDQNYILVDLQGGIWSGGAHVRGLGYKNDIEKMNAATAMGYRVFWFTSGMVEDGSAIKFLEEVVWQIK